MKKRKLILSAILSTTLLASGSLFFIANANVPVDDANKKKLKTCSVQSGDDVIQIGNTCESGGNGCNSNPCDD